MALPAADSATADMTGELLGYELRAGIIAREEHQRRIDAWLQHWRARCTPATSCGSGAALWVQAFPVEMMSKRDAERALETLPTLATFPPPGNYYSSHLDGRYGEILRRAGRIDEAIARLEAATRQCSDGRWPSDLFLLGEAYEAKGDTVAACRNYSAVLRFWGHAKPRSITADAARARFTKLACPAP